MTPKVGVKGVLFTVQIDTSCTLANPGQAFTTSETLAVSREAASTP